MKKEKMFNKSYPYRSSKSKLVTNLFKELSKKIKKRFRPKNILEIGCNDGTFASNFNKKNITCIEPCGDVAIDRANAGIDPEPTMIYATELVKENPVIETLWASSREVFNVIQAERCGTDIITLAPNLIAGMKDIGRDLDEYSLDTVKMFFNDSVAAGFKI